MNDLRPERILAHLEAIESRVRAEVPRDLERWETSPEDYEERLRRIERFANQRPAVVRTHMQERFGLSQPVALTVEIEGEEGGKVRINAVTPDTYPWMGTYFEGMEVHLEALPEAGYRFIGWSVPDGRDEPRLRISLDGARQVVAVFEPAARDSAAEEGV